MTAEALLIAGENAEEYEELRGALRIPTSRNCEAVLVDRIAVTVLRLRRAPRCEAAIFNFRMAEKADSGAISQVCTLELGAALSLDGAAALGKLEAPRKLGDECEGCMKFCLKFRKAAPRRRRRRP